MYLVINGSFKVTCLQIIMYVVYVYQKNKKIIKNLKKKVKSNNGGKS